MRAPSIWKTLGIKATGDKAEIRRAYAKKLKQTHPEDDPEGFKVLRAAYEDALQRAAWADVRPAPRVDEAIESEDADEVDRGTLPRPNVQVVTDAVSRNADGSFSVDIKALLGDMPPPQDIEPPADTPAPARGQAFRPQRSSAFSAAQAHLQSVLAPQSEADNDARIAALKAVLTAPELDHIETRQTTENWLLSLLINTRPRSDVLLAPAIEYFGWSARKLERHQPFAVQQVFRREADLTFLKNIRTPGYEFHNAWLALSRPPKPPTLFSRFFPGVSSTEVRGLLQRIRDRQETVEDDLNAEAVAAWEERLRHPDRSTFTVWMMAAAPICVLLAMAAYLAWGERAVPLFYVLGLPLLWVIGTHIHPYIHARPRQAWLDNWQWQRKPWLAYGWGPLLIALFFVAALPPAPWLIACVAVMSVFVAWWAVITGDIDKGVDEHWPWQVRLAASELFLVGWWLVLAWDLPADAIWQMSPVVLAAVLVSGFGRLPLYGQWHRLGLWPRRGALAALCLLAVGAIALLWIMTLGDLWAMTIKGEALRPLAFASAAVVILLHRVPTLAVVQGAAAYLRTAAYLALFLSRTQGGALMTVSVAGSVLLVWTLINCAAALYGTFREERA